MPELPEVETVVRGLRDELCGRKIVSARIKEATILGYPHDKDEFANTLENKNITGMSRRGKYIVIELSDEKFLIVHLRMTGKLLIRNSESILKKHTHAIFRLDDDRDLRFNNVRKFGRLYLVDQDELEKAGSFSKLGPEPLSDDFDESVLEEIFAGRKAPVKSVLLDQKKLAGMGNIYSDEALFRAGIKPDKPAGELSSSEIKKLYNSIITVLKAGIKYRGTTFSDYVDALGESGDFQDELRVYGREEDSCPSCGCEIEKEKISGRSSHYCPSCQE